MKKKKNKRKGEIVINRIIEEWIEIKRQKLIKRKKVGLISYLSPACINKEQIKKMYYFLEIPSGDAFGVFESAWN